MTHPRAKTPIEKAPVADGDLEARKRPLDDERLLPEPKPEAPFDGSKKFDAEKRKAAKGKKAKPE
jgi:hypothetical protein